MFRYVETRECTVRVGSYLQHTYKCYGSLKANYYAVRHNLFENKFATLCLSAPVRTKYIQCSKFICWYVYCMLTPNPQTQYTHRSLLSTL